MHLKFNHFALRAEDPKRMKTFFNALGFEEGERPHFPFEGYWLYSDDMPIIHIFGSGVRFRDEDTVPDQPHRKPIVDHIAFTSEDYASTIQVIKEHGLDYAKNIVPGTNIAQIFVSGPENLIVEIQAKIN